MLDNFSDLQLVVVTLVLMALFSYGGVRGYRAGRRWIARRYIRKIVRECQMASAVSRLGPTLAYSQGHSTRARHDGADQSRTAVRAVQGHQIGDWGRGGLPNTPNQAACDACERPGIVPPIGPNALDPDSCYATTSLSAPKDVA